MKNILILFVLVFATSLTAQTTKKVIKKIEKSDTEIYNDKDANTFKSMKVEKELVNGKEQTSYKLIIEEGGEKKVIKWDGEGEMPKEIEAELAKMEEGRDGNFEIYEEHEIVMEENKNGEKKVMVWKGDGEMPDDMKRMMEEDEENHVKNGERKIMKFISEDEMEYDVKVKMGIGLSDGKDGVRVEQVMENSPASNAGIKEGDIILKMNDTYILSDDKLMEFLSNQKAGDKVKVIILRNGKEQTMKIQLEAK